MPEVTGRLVFHCFSNGHSVFRHVFANFNFNDIILQKLTDRTSITVANCNKTQYYTKKFVRFSIEDYVSCYGPQKVVAFGKSVRKVWKFIFSKFSAKNLPQKKWKFSGKQWVQLELLNPLLGRHRTALQIVPQTWKVRQRATCPPKTWAFNCVRQCLTGPNVLHCQKLRSR